MIYAATAVWLTVVVLLAWGVHQLWSGIVKPKTVNTVVLPGTVIAQIGRVVGLLITGATVNNAAVVGDGDNREPTAQTAVRSKIPVVGPMVVALLPMVALGFAILVVTVKLGDPVACLMPADGLPVDLPSSLAAFWDRLRGLITLAEQTLESVRGADGSAWKIATFTYLMICFTVRMAPMPGNALGHIGAIAAVGVVAALAATLSPLPGAWIAEAWPVLSLAIGWLLLLLLISLIARGAVGVVRLIMRSA